MATVRFSQELKDAIIKNAERLFDKQVNDAQGKDRKSTRLNSSH